MPQNNTEPLYVGIDVDALLAQIDQEDRRRAMERRASGRRRGPRRSPLTVDFDTRFALGAERPPALRSAHLA